jgi:purine-binding chemotaxis protein CheW
MSDLIPATANLGTFCTFRVQERLYGVDVTQVREISTHVTLTPVAQAPSIVRGLANLRSRIYLVLDIRPALGLPPAECTPDSRLIVLHPRVAENLALFADHGGDIVRALPEQMEAAGPRGGEDANASTEQSASPVVGVCKLKTELMMIIDPARLVAAVEQAIR